MLDRNKAFLDSFNFALLGLSKLIEIKIKNSPKLLNLEVTKKCNARCDFCDYWQTQHEERLYDYSDLIKKINPLVVMVTGGEPMLRKDIVESPDTRCSPIGENKLALTIATSRCQAVTCRMLANLLTSQLQ